MAWFLTLKAKLIGAGILLLLLVWGFRVWLVKHDQAVWQDGRTAGAAEIEKQKRAEWEAKEQEIRVDAAALDVTKRATEADRARVAQDRVNVSNALKNALASVRNAREQGFTTAAAVPASELDAAIRAISAELAAAR